MQDENMDSALKQAGKMASDVAKRQIKRAAAKKIVTVTVATSGGCLIPVVVFLIILLVGGFLSAFTVNKKFNFDEIKKTAEQKGVSAQDELFNQIYDSSGKLLFTKKELDSMVFDKRSLKRMFELISEYNKEELKEEINVEFKGTFRVWEPDGGYEYYMYEAPSYRQVSITKEEYEEYSREENEKNDETGEEDDWSAPDRILSRVETGEYVTKEHTTTEKVELDDTWIREQYPIDWQIIYLLCYYDSFDNGNKSTEMEEGEKIRLSKNYIKTVIEDVAVNSYSVVPDVSADNRYVRIGAGDSAHDLDSINYNWDKGLFASVSQDEIKDYGAYVSHPNFTGRTTYQWRTYTVTYSGNVRPVTKLKEVQTLCTVDSYNTRVAPQDSRDLVSQRYTLEKLEALLEKYGNRRDMDIFLAALKELPGGEEIAAPIEEAIIILELEEGK